MSRFGDEKEALWRKIILYNYAEDKWGWVPKSAPRYRVSGLWGPIASVGDESNVPGKVFGEGVGFKVRDGRDICFWSSV